MAQQKDRLVVIGEGITEFYYIQSLRDIFPGLAIRPDRPKHTDMTQLAKKIDESVSKGYRYVFCIIDMDTKSTDKAEQRRYIALRNKYKDTISRPKKGILCDVRFFETHLCTELFFLYYFRYTSRHYGDQPELLAELNSFCVYEKSESFFRKCGGLHPYFEKKGGCLDAAVNHANRSVDERDATGRAHTYSELGRLITALRELA